MDPAKDSTRGPLAPQPVAIPWRSNATLMTSIVRGVSQAPVSHANAPAAVVIFVNGLGRPMAAWEDTRNRLSTAYTTVAYDRFGQGVTPPLPADVPDTLRDGAAAARDLHELVEALAARGDLGADDPPTTSPAAAAAGAAAGAAAENVKIVLVAHSIGVAIARLFLSSNSNSSSSSSSNNNNNRHVAGALFLDPSPVNSDFVSLYPAPRPDEPADLTETREATRRIFHPDAPNPERFNRRTFAALLPRADVPVPDGDPYVTVVAHDPPIAFGEASEKLGIKSKYALQYVEPYWQDYNRGLLRSVSPEKRRGPLKADGADHFIQVCRPDMVADEIERLVKTVTSTP